MAIPPPLLFFLHKVLTLYPGKWGGISCDVSQVSVSIMASKTRENDLRNASRLSTLFLICGCRLSLYFGVHRGQLKMASHSIDFAELYIALGCNVAANTRFSCRAGTSPSQHSSTHLHQNTGTMVWPVHTLGRSYLGL